MAEEAPLLLLHAADDVLIAKKTVVAGTRVRVFGLDIEMREDFLAGHKVARRAIAQGSPVRRYGQIIGFATASIEAGEHVHVHNLAVGDRRQKYEPGVDYRPVEMHPPERMRYFDGFRRRDGRVGTRNYVAIVASGKKTKSELAGVGEEEFAPWMLGPVL